MNFYLANRSYALTSS